MARRTNQRTWAVVGNGAGLHISEVGEAASADQLLTYDEAKEQALAQLRQHVAPYWERMAELMSDHDLEAGAYPTSKAWFMDRICEGKVVVIARTKAQAIDFCKETRYSFDRHYSAAKGDSWYRLARDGDGVWIEERDESNKGTGVFYRPIDQHEAEQTLEQALASYRTMRIERVAAMKGQVKRETRVTSVGTPYKLTVHVTNSAWEPDTLLVYAEIDDCLGWWSSRAISSIERTIRPAVDWKNEGF